MILDFQVTHVLDLVAENGVLEETIYENNQEIKYYKFSTFCNQIKYTSKEANPRKQDITKRNKVTNKIRSTLLDPTLSFHTRNKGITYFADNVKVYINEEGLQTVRITFTDLTSQGSVDGGHTELVILDEMGKFPEWKKVNIEVMTGIKNSNTHVTIAESRNIGAQVTAETLDELSGMHSILKDHLDNTEFANRVSYKQNESKEDGKDLTVTLIKKLYETFNIRDYSEKDPKSVYSSNQSIIKKYREEYEKNGNTNKNVYEKLRHVSNDIFHLTNFIHKNFKDLYNKYGKSNYLALKCADYKENYPKEAILFGEDGDFLDYKIPNGLLFLTLSGFRVFLKENGNGYYEWKIDIFDQNNLKEILKEVFTIVSQGMRNNDNNPQSVGKDPTLWHLARTQMMMLAFKNQWI